MFGQWWPEPAAIEFIESNRLAGRMITFFNWGEYGIWHLAPSVKVSIDGRRETVYSDAVVAGHFHFYEGTKDGISYIESVQADYAWLPAAMPGASALRQNGWEAIFEGGQSVILAGRHVPRRGGSIVVPSSTPDQTTRCFPGP